MAFLDYLLGGVSGGFEGYERRKAKELQAQKDEEERQIRLASLFSQGFEPVADVQRKKQAAIGAAGSLIGSALDAASGGLVRSLPSMADQEALGKGYATAKPERTMTFGGQQLALRETATERQDRLAREEEMRKRRAAEDVANAAIQAKKNRVESLVASGLTRAQATQAVELDAKYGDVSETPSVLATKRGQDISAATTRRGQDISAATARLGKDLTDKPIPVPASDRRSMTELAASIKELDKALEAANKNPNAFGLKTVLPNMLLTRQGGVKARADVTGAIVKLRRTEFGTAMSKQEKESGLPLFPAIGGMSGGDDAEAIKEKLTALKEKAMLELNTKRDFYGMPTYEASVGAAPAAPAPAKTPTAAPAKAPAQAQTLGQWMDANPQRQGETDAQYEARYKASAKGGR